MTVAILFDAIRTNGGSYQMSVNNLITFIKNFEKKKIEYIILTHKKNLTLSQLKINYKIIKITIGDFFYIFLKKILLLENLLNRFNFQSKFEKKLIKKNVKIIIFLFTSWKAFLLKKIDFTATILDTCHIDFKGTKKFKEISLGVFLFREYINKNILPKAKKIITESQDLKKKIINIYHLNPKTIITIPNLPSIFLKKRLSVNTNKNISPFKNFYFYPAQFWEHKNHILILEAIKKLKTMKKNINFIFCGRDKGNLKKILKKINEYGIQQNIKIFNYLKDEEILELYKQCRALIMPSFFGPTNMPPVESWFLRVPVGYSSSNKNHGKNAAIYFHPRSADQLAGVILKLELKKIRKKLIKMGKKRIKEIYFENNYNHKKFSSDIKNFLKVRKVSN